MKTVMFKGLRILSVVLFLVLLGFIAFWHFPNRDLSILVETTEKEYEMVVEYSDIVDAKEVGLEFGDTNCLTIKKVRVYGNIKTICLKKLDYSDFAANIAYVSDGEMKWENDGLQFTGADKVNIVLNENGVSLFKNLSESFLLERLCLIEVALIVCMLLFVVFTALIEKYDVNNRDNHGPIYEFKRFWADIRKYSNYMVYAAKTDLKAEVANSYLNRLWWLLEPFFNMLVYVVVFGGMMGKSIENYVIFVFSALLMWNFFSKTINYSVKCVRNNRDIVTKVYVPKFVLLIVNMILNFFKLLFSMIVLVGMLLIFRVGIGIETLMVIPAYLVMILLAFGVGMIFLHYGVYVDDLSYAVGILLSMLMFLSGTFYDVMATLSAPLNTLMLCLNPVAMVIDTMRNALIYKEIVNVPLVGIWLAISVILCCIGVHIVYKNENGYVKVV